MRQLQAVESATWLIPVQGYYIWSIGVIQTTTVVNKGHTKGHGPGGNTGGFPMPLIQLNRFPIRAHVPGGLIVGLVVASRSTTLAGKFGVVAHGKHDAVFVTALDKLGTASRNNPSI